MKRKTFEAEPSDLPQAYATALNSQRLIGTLQHPSRLYLEKIYDFQRIV